MSAELADYIRRTVEAAPPLTTEQRARLSVLLSLRATAQGGRPVESAAVRAARLEERRRDEERRARQSQAAALTRALTSCAICGIPRAGHLPSSAATHGWEQGDPEGLAADFFRRQTP